MFPVELPTFEATWWPLQMETIPGSGETLTVGVLVRASSGQSQVRQSIQPAAIASLFGATAGKGMQSMVGSTVIEIQRQLDGGSHFDQLDLPFGGFRFGHPRDCTARDLNEIFDIAVRLSTAFGVSPFGHRQEVSDSSRRAFEDWAERVRVDLMGHQSQIDFDPSNFNVRVRLAAKKDVRFGFMVDGYAANFGVLRPGHTSGDTRSLKVKLFDLEALRRDQILPVDKTEVLLGCPHASALDVFSGREVDTFHSSMAFLESEARARNVDLVRFPSHTAAAEHIRGRVAKLRSAFR